MRFNPKSLGHFGRIGFIASGLSHSIRTQQTQIQITQCSTTHGPEKIKDGCATGKTAGDQKSRRADLGGGFDQTGTVRSIDHGRQRILLFCVCCSCYHDHDKPTGSLGRGGQLFRIR